MTGVPFFKSGLILMDSFFLGLGLCFFVRPVVGRRFFQARFSPNLTSSGLPLFFTPENKPKA